MKKDAFKSIGAVLAGLIAIVVLSNGTDTMLETIGVFPPIAVQREQGFGTMWMVMLALVYRSIYIVVGGYVAAALAPNRPIRHAIALGIVGIALGILGAIATWGVTPAWFSISLVILGLPCVWLGGKLKTG